MLREQWLNFWRMIGLIITPGSYWCCAHQDPYERWGKCTFHCFQEVDICGCKRARFRDYVENDTDCYGQYFLLLPLNTRSGLDFPPCWLMKLYTAKMDKDTASEFAHEMSQRLNRPCVHQTAQSAWAKMFAKAVA